MIDEFEDETTEFGDIHRVHRRLKRLRELERVLFCATGGSKSGHRNTNQVIGGLTRQSQRLSSHQCSVR